MFDPENGKNVWKVAVQKNNHNLQTLLLINKIEEPKQKKNPTQAFYGVSQKVL